MSLKARLRSFAHAFAGIAAMLRTQPNAWLHLLATVSVVGFGLYVDLSLLEWSLITVVVAMVWSAEALNTAIEDLADVVSPDPDPRIKKVKDVAAAGVLLAAIGAAVVGFLVLGPHLLALLN